MTSYREQVARALRAVEVTSTTSFRWFGCPSPRLAPEMTAALSRGPARKYLIGRIERELYRSFYTQGDPVPIRSSPESFSSDAGFVETLSAANRGAGGWDPGWQIAQIEPLQVTKNGLRVQVAHADCRLEGTGLSVGAEASLRRPKGEPAFFPGFYMAVGNADPIAAPDDLEVRLYFHVTGDGAVPLTALTTRVLNEARIPFRLKLLADRRAYVRCDAAVLYLREDGFADVRSELGYIVSACARHLRCQAPAFAAPLGRGVAVGEHRPRLGTSFGAVRCRLLAEAIVVSHEAGARRLDARLDAVATAFAAQGLDVDAPYRVPGSTARYEL